MLKLISKILICLLIAASFVACSEELQKEKTVTPVIDEKASQQISVVNDEVCEQIEEIKTSFIGVGDNIIYGTKEAKLKAEEGGRKYNYKPYYDGVSEHIANADISFINQETLMCGDGYSLSYYPMFNSPQELGYDLSELGFDVINISNNHMLDKGADGLSKTIEFWKSTDVLMIGGYENEDDFSNIRILEKDGIKIAFLSYCEMTNGLVKSANSPVVIPYLDEDIIIEQTAKAKEVADLIFVSVHWGDEGSFKPNNSQIKYAQLFADCGVDVILGHHPHVIQPVEWLYGRDGNKTLCVYSLGNFMAQQDFDYNMVGGMISFDIIHSAVKEPTIENVQFIPTLFHFNGRFCDNNVYLFSNYPKELCQSHGVKNYYGHRFEYDRLLSYITSTIDKSFLPDFYYESTSDDEQI